MSICTSSEEHFLPVYLSFQYEFEFMIKEDLNGGGNNNKIFFCNIRLKK